MSTGQTFQKSERLKSKKLIESLFQNGTKKNYFPLKVFVFPQSSNVPFPIKLLVSVPKRNMKRAVKRNRIKRLIRESWRLNKNHLYQRLNEQNLTGVVMLMYTGSEIPVKKDIDAKMPLLISFILGELQKKAQ